MKILLLTFGIVGVLVLISPDFMLELFGRWAVLMQAVGARSAAELGSPQEMFRHTMTTNGIILGIYLLVGFLLQAALVMPIAAAISALVAFLAPQTISRAFSFPDWVLIVVEAFVLILGASIASGVAGELYAVRSERRSSIQYWKKAWRTL